MVDGLLAALAPALSYLYHIPAVGLIAGIYLLARTLKIFYIYVGAFEREQMTAPIHPPGDPVYREGRVTIYQVPP